MGAPRDVSKNKFSEDFPTVLTRMTRVKHMKLGRNDFTGSIPASITSLVSLTYLPKHHPCVFPTKPCSFCSPPARFPLSHSYVNYEATPCGYGECEVVQYSGTAFCRACTDFCDTCSRRGEEEGEEMF
ncbi:unnamed protein product [Closterium sp. NIES-64]|nr:unnamed protein product [Closterium sp. NIES-64]